MRSNTAKLIAGTGALALALSACGDGGGDGDGEDVSLTFTWWGGDVRHEYTQQMIELFEEEHPNITVDVQYHEWDGYWDQLATQTAGQDTPDIVQMDLVYLREYIENGVLLELDQGTIDTSEYSDELVDNGMIDDELYAMPVGSTALTFGANPDIFDEAGVQMPDDETWTWDELQDMAVQISQNTEAYGQAGSFDSAGFETWLRQNLGVSQVDADGNLAWEPEEAVGYFEMLGESQQAGAFPDASEMAEQRGIAREQTLLATGDAAMFPAWDTMLIALSSNEGIDLEPLMMPSETGDAADAGMYYKASMFYSAYSGTDHPEEAQQFIDFMVNDEEAGQLQQIERGIPGNASVRELIREDLGEMETRIMDYSERLEDAVAEAPPLAPEGFGAVQDIVIRYEDEFFFGRLSAEEAAEQMHAEIEDAIS